MFIGPDHLKAYNRRSRSLELIGPYSETSLSLSVHVLGTDIRWRQQIAVMHGKKTFSVALSGMPWTGTCVCAHTAAIRYRARTAGLSREFIIFSFHSSNQAIPRQLSLRSFFASSWAEPVSASGQSMIAGHGI